MVMNMSHARGKMVGKLNLTVTISPERHGPQREPVLQEGQSAAPVSALGRFEEMETWLATEELAIV